MLMTLPCPRSSRCGPTARQPWNRFGQVDVNDAVPFGFGHAGYVASRQLRHRFAYGVADAVDQRVDVPELGDGALHDGVGVGSCGRVPGQRKTLPAQGSNLFRNLVHACRGQPGYRHVRAGLGEGQRNAFANAPASSGQQYFLAGNVEYVQAHRSPPGHGRRSSGAALIRQWCHIAPSPATANGLSPQCEPSPPPVIASPFLLLSLLALSSSCHCEPSPPPVIARPKAVAISLTATNGRSHPLRPSGRSPKRRDCRVAIAPRNDSSVMRAPPLRKAPAIPLDSQDSCCHCEPPPTCCCEPPPTCCCEPPPTCCCEPPPTCCC